MQSVIAEKDRRLAALLEEKEHVSSLLKAKDVRARELMLELQCRRRLRCTGAAEAPDLPFGESSSNANAGRSTPRRRGSRPAQELQASASSGTPPAKLSHLSPASGLRSAGATGAWPETEETCISPRPPGVSARFAGWRDADDRARLGAIKAENAVLLTLLTDRDAELQGLSAELARLQREHAIMRVTWRQAHGRISKGRRHVAIPEPRKRAVSSSPDSVLTLLEQVDAHLKAESCGSASSCAQLQEVPAVAVPLSKENILASRVAAFTEKVAASAGLGLGPLAHAAEDS